MAEDNTGSEQDNLRNNDDTGTGDAEGDSESNVEEQEFDYEEEYHNAVDELAFVTSILEVHAPDVDVKEAYSNALYRRDEDGNYIAVYNKPADTQEDEEQDDKPAPKRNPPRKLKSGNMKVKEKDTKPKSKLRVFGINSTSL